MTKNSQHRKQKTSPQKTSTGLERNVASALCYAVGWVTGLIFLLIEKEDKTVRFHALQSIVTFGAITILMMIPGVRWMASRFLSIIGLVLWIILMIKAYQGEKFKLPIIGDFVENQLKNIKI